MNRTVKIILTAIIIAAWCGFAYPESGRVIFQSPLIWRADGEGDYMLPKLGRGVYETEEIFLAAGEIKSITASWQSKGDVSLQVSVNGGRRYLPVTNGVPLTFEDKSGREIRWKATVGRDSELKEVKIVYSDTSGVISSFGNPQLSGFKYRKLIHIGSKGKASFNQPVRLKASRTLSEGVDFSFDGVVSSDFRDIRFCAADGETILPHYLANIENSKSSPAAEIFIKVLQMPVEGVDVYVYYGNKIASQASDLYSVYSLDRAQYTGKDVEEAIEDITVLYPDEVTVLEDEGVELNKFANVTVKENGNLSLVDGAAKGIFTSSAQNAEFDVRIINARYKVVNPDKGTLKLDVSADAGASFRTNCISGRSYYVSRKDFSVGSEIVYRFTLSAGSQEKDSIEVTSIGIDYFSGEVSLISPNGGEVFIAGEEQRILWSANEYGEYNLKLEYSLDNGKTYKLISKTVPNTGDFTWMVPQEFSDTVVIKISDPYDLRVFDTSNVPFTITSKEEAGRVTAPGAVEEGVQESIDLSSFVDTEVKRSDRKSYDLLVKVRPKLKDPNASLDDVEITYTKGEVTDIQLTGYEWGSSEKRKFLVMRVYLTDDEADRMRPKTINVGETSADSIPVLKEQKSIVNLQTLGFKGRKMGQVRKALERNILSREVIEQVIE